MSRSTLLMMCSAWLAACSNGSGQVALQPDAGLEARADAADGPDAVRELPPPVDAGDAADALPLPEVTGDAEVDAARPQCKPGEGCFLDKCQANQSCQSGWCVQYLGDSVCTQICQEECPAGWRCKQVAGTDPDVVYICVSDYANLCRPCAGNVDCTSAGGAEDACLAYGPQGSFCGGPCDKDGECPWGFSCQEIESVEGALLTQCVSDTGECPCTDDSVALGLGTPCEAANEFGTCEGMRLCTEEGLSACDAPSPAAEECNGSDDDCDSEVDEPNLVEGAYVLLCDDGNPCTSDSCAGEQGCVNTKLESGECSDGNPCTVADHCAKGACVGDPVECDDQNPCTQNVCTQAGGCEYPAQPGPCDDGDPCTVADLCEAAQCAGTPISCDCQTDADCAGLEDGNLCNGTLFCDDSGLPFQCAVLPGSVVSCPDATGGAAVCLAPWCDPVTGMCGFVPDHDGYLCSDEDECTVGSTCEGGSCKGGQAVNCNDGDPCTDDLCESATGCVHKLNAAACDDGNACTVGDQCAGGECKGMGLQDCDDGDACNGKESCDAAKGCVAGQAPACNDGNVCNGSETCNPLKGCMAGLPLACDDGNACDGMETCSPAIGCQPGSPLTCDDKDACNGKEWCDMATGCQPGTPLQCDDANPCTNDSCVPASGCEHVPNAAGCEDGNACTAGDHCAGGKCQAGEALACNDGNLCTDDLCDPQAGCIYKVNLAPCDDGDVCTTNDSCQVGTCVSGPKLQCNDGNPCTDDGCSAETGCQFLANDHKCTDGSACTTGDHCKAGLCVVAGFLDCQDDNACTDDSCNPESGCVHAANAAACQDGSVCTVGDVCKASVCVPGPAMSCDDANPCTDDSCDPALGCVHAPNSQACSDGNLCTPFDKCQAGQCVGSGTVDCDDDNACTDDSCDPKLACLHTNNTAACNDDNACTTADKCADGSCAGGPPLGCDDGKECTADDCVPATGCSHSTLEDGTACGGGKVCKKGECVLPCTPGSKTLTYTGSSQTFVVPEACVAVKIEAWAGQGGAGSGGAAGGLGGYAAGNLTVAPGTTLYVYVGGQATSFNGGGAGGADGAGTGGGATDVRLGGTDPTQRVIVAGGGGGGGGRGCNANHVGGNGGEGGGGTGGKGQDSPNGGGGYGGGPGFGGSPGVGCSCCLGAAGSASGAGGAGQTCCCGVRPGGGGGGGGYLQAGGGGGGSAGTTGCMGNDKGGGGGGGGGTSYTGGMTSGTSTQNGVWSGPGKVVITW